MADYKQYVADLYRNELGRYGDAVSQDELDAWVNALSSGGMTQQQAADMIERSPEGVAYDVNRIYQTDLGRTPDEAGSASWGQALASGALSDEQFQQMVRQSPEYADVSVAQYKDLLNKVYEQEVGRAPDAAGAAQWATALRAGSVKPEQLSGMFSNTNEGWLFDQYANLFGRRPDAAARPWLDALENKSMTRDQVMAQLMAAPEYQKANPGKAGVVLIPGAAAGSPGYVSAYQNYAPMKPLADPRSQTFGFLYDTINERLGRDVTPKGLLDVDSINAGFAGRPATAVAPPAPVNWAGGAVQQTPASTGGYAGTGTTTTGGYAGGGTSTTGGNANNPNLVGGILDARNLVSSIYQQELNRQPDYAGWDAWSNAVYNGMTQQQLVDAIRASSEYQGLKSGSTAEAPMASYDVGGGGR